MCPACPRAADGPGLAGLSDRSYAPKAHPWRTSAEVEAVICDLRAARRSWGPRRLVFGLERRGHPGVSRSTVYRVLVRHHLIEPVSRRRRRDSYRRWERSAAMELWQMDVTASLFLADGRECKVITGIDDHSRFCVIATVVTRAAARAVCLAFTGAMAEYGIPAELTRSSQLPAASEAPEPDDGAAAPPPESSSDDGQGKAVGLDRAVPPSGNLWIAGQQVWLGPAMTGRTVRLWAGLSQVHVLLDGHRVKTLPSRLDARDLARLAAAGARPAGPPPLPPASGDVIEVDRTVNACGNVSLGDRIVSAGLPLAGQRVTLRLEGPAAHVLAGGVLVRAVACPVPAGARPRLRGARPGTVQPPRLPGPLVVTRRVSVRGPVMVGQKIQVGLAHARKAVQVTVGADTYQVAVENGISSRDVRRHKASNYG